MCIRDSNSVVSLYYYARIVKAMFLEPSDEIETISFSVGNLALLIVLVVPTVVIGFWNTLYKVSLNSLGKIMG